MPARPRMLSVQGTGCSPVKSRQSSTGRHGLSQQEIHRHLISRGPAVVRPAAVPEEFSHSHRGMGTFNAPKISGASAMRDAHRIAESPRGATEFSGRAFGSDWEEMSRESLSSRTEAPKPKAAERGPTVLKVGTETSQRELQMEREIMLLRKHLAGTSSSPVSHEDAHVELYTEYATRALGSVSQDDPEITALESEIMRLRGNARPQDAHVVLAEEFALNEQQAIEPENENVRNPLLSDELSSIKADIKASLVECESVRADLIDMKDSSEVPQMSMELINIKGDIMGALEECVGVRDELQTMKLNQQQDSPVPQESPSPRSLSKKISKSSDMEQFKAPSPGSRGGDDKTRPSISFEEWRLKKDMTARQQARHNRGGQRGEIPNLSVQARSVHLVGKGGGGGAMYCESEGKYLFGPGSLQVVALQPFESMCDTSNIQ